MTWRVCPCGCEDADGYSKATDPRTCPGCGATRMSGAAFCRCGFSAVTPRRSRDGAPLTGRRALEILIEKRGGPSDDAG